MTTLKREKLYEDAWARPALKIAAELGISSSALKRICVSMNIPTPPLGYWTKTASGKKLKKKKLPKANEDTRLEHVVNKENSKRQREINRHRPTPQEKESFPEITIADNLDNLHPLVKKTRTHLRELWSNKSWRDRKVRKRLDAEVSASSLDRALLFLDAVVRGVEAQGLKLSSSMDCPTARRDLEKPHYERAGTPSECCWVLVGEEHVCFSLREKNRREYFKKPEDRKYSWQDWEDVPSGKLEFSLDVSSGFNKRRVWRDGKIQRIEQFVSEIVARFPQAGEYMRLETIERKKREIEWAIEEKRRKEREEIRWHFQQQCRQEARAVEKLLEDVEKHEKAESIRSFHKACKSEVLQRYGEQPYGSGLDLWLRWVEARADILDPVCGGPLPWMHSGLPDVIGMRGAEE
ncbi:MAG: hypothetical protein QM496_16565 [Verrucomicrobiota bacterium]